MKSHLRYELFDEIGRGETAVVYRGRDMNLRIPVAIKVFREELRADAQLFDEFCRSAQSLATLGRHDRIVLVREVDRDFGWVIMDLMRESVEGVLVRGRIEIPLVRSILRQCLEGLKVLHQNGMLHGRLKPSNLLVDEQGLVRLSDCMGAISGREIPAPRGSYRYLAPELCDPGFGPVGPGIDLYATGFSVLELLMGKDAFARYFAKAGVDSGPDSVDKGMSWLRWHGSRDDTLASVSTIVPGVPDDIARTLDGLLKKEVSARFNSADVALETLEMKPILVIDQVATERPDPGTGGVVRTVKSRPQPQPITEPKSDPGSGRVDWRSMIQSMSARVLRRKVLIPAGLVLLLILAGAVMWAMRAHMPRQLSRAGLQAIVVRLFGGGQKPKPQDGEPPTTSDQGTKNQNAPDENKPAKGDPKLVSKTNDNPNEGETAKEDSPISPSQQPMGSSITIQKEEPRISPKNGLICKWAAHEGTVFAVAATADGRKLATGGGDGLIRIWDIGPALAGDGQAPKKVHEFNFGAKVFDVAITPDGRRVYAAGESQSLHAFDIDANTPVSNTRLTTEGTRIWRVALSDNGAKGICGGQDRAVWVWDVARHEVPLRLHALYQGEADIMSVAMDHEGRTGLSGDSKGIVRFFDIRSRQVRDFRAHNGFVKCVAFSPIANAQLAVTCGEDRLSRVWDLVSGKVLVVLKGHSDWVTCATFRSDGRAILTCSYDKSIRVWSSDDGRQLDELHEHEDGVEGITLVGESLAASCAKDRMVALWNLQQVNQP